MISTRRLYQQVKNIYHFLQAYGWRTYYGWPDRKMKIYGITGTNGKTTTSIILGSILREQYGQDKVGLLTTIVFWFGDEEKVNETKMTTMKSKLVFSYLKRMKEKGVECVVLEMTSHALDQHRLAGIRLDGAIFLNIAREHLDYHKDMKTYARAKARIVGYLKSESKLVAKMDDKWIKYALLENPNFKIQISNKAQIPKSKFLTVTFTSEQARGVVTPLVGDVNKENVLAASLLAEAVGVNEVAIKRGVIKVKQVPGRMEWVTTNDQFPIPNDQPMTNSQMTNNRLPRVLIDYAVTPDALERLYGDLRQQIKGKIFAVLGACGLRDRGKRPEMARVVARYADELVLTREDPWTENEEQIFSDLEEGLRAVDTAVATHSTSRFASVELTPTVVGVDLNRCSCQGWRQRATAAGQIAGEASQVSQRRKGRQSKSTEERGAEWRRITDRRDAIKYCLKKAGPDDVVVVTGKGAETGMAVGDNIVPWSDKEVILELLQETYQDL